MNIKEKLKWSITLPVWCYTESSRAKEELGMEKTLTIEDYEVRGVDFYDICAAYPCHHDLFGDYTLIVAGGTEFSCSMSKEQFDLFLQDIKDGFK